MSNAVFPTLPGITWGGSMSPAFSTKVQRAVSGRELRAAYMAYPLWTFGLVYEFLQAGNRGADLNTLTGFFLARKGQFDSFLFTAPHDNSVTGMGFGAGNGSLINFQLTRSLGGFVEPVQNLNGAPSIYVAGALKTAGTDYTIDSNGVVTFASAPANGSALTWTGAFYYRCRFAQDAADFAQFMADLWDLKKLQLVGSPMNKV